MYKGAAHLASFAAGAGGGGHWGSGNWWQSSLVAWISSIVLCHQPFHKKDKTIAEDKWHMIQPPEGRAQELLVKRLAGVHRGYLVTKGN